MALTTIPDDFGSGARNLVPDGSGGTPSARDVFREHKTAIENLSGKRTVTITHETLTAAATSQVVNIGAALPAGARITGREIRTTTPFSGGSAGAVAVDIGGTDADAIVDGASVFTGAPAAQAGTSGINPSGTLGGQQLTATVTSDVNVAALTAGSMTIDVWYAIDP